MSRKKNKKKTDEYLINRIEYSTWENELTLSRSYGDVVSTYVQTKCLPAIAQPTNTPVVSDVIFINNDPSSQDDSCVDVLVADGERTTSQQQNTTEYGVAQNFSEPSLPSIRHGTENASQHLAAVPTTNSTTDGESIASHSSSSCSANGQTSGIRCHLHKEMILHIKTTRVWMW